MSTGYSDLDALVPRLEAVPTLGAEALEAEAVAVLGRKSGVLTAALKRLATLPIEERKRFGAAVPGGASLFTRSPTDYSSRLRPTSQRHPHPAPRDRRGSSG